MVCEVRFGAEFLAVYSPLKIRVGYQLQLGKVQPCVLLSGPFGKFPCDCGINDLDGHF